MTTPVRQDNAIWRWAVIVIALANWGWLLIALPTFSDVGISLFPGFLILIPGALVLAVIQLVVLWYANLHRPVPARWFLAAGSVAAVLSTVCWSTDLDLRCRIWLSEDDLLKFVDNVNQRRPEDFVGDGGGAGLFRFVRYYRHAGGAVRFDTGYGFKNPHGIQYVPPGAEPPERGRHVYGPWYQYGGG